MNSSNANELERLAEQAARNISSLNDSTSSLIKTMQAVEKIAAAADSMDLRNAFSLKSDISTLAREVDELSRNLQTLQRELTDAKSALRRALY